MKLFSQRDLHKTTNTTNKFCAARHVAVGGPPLSPRAYSYTLLATMLHHVRLTLSHRHPSHTSITQSPRNVSRPLTTSHTPHNKHSPTHHDPAAALTTADAARRAPAAAPDSGAGDRSQRSMPLHNSTAPRSAPSYGDTNWYTRKAADARALGEWGSGGAAPPCRRVPSW